MFGLGLLKKSKEKEPYKILHTDLPIPTGLPILTITTTTTTPTSTTPTATTPGTTSSTSVQNIINLNTSKAEPFKNHDPKEWIVQYDVVSKANGWDNTKKLNNIPPLFQQSKNARQWYSYTYKNLPPTDYKDFCKKLIDTLSPSNDKYVSFTKMYERKQQLAEPPIEYFFAKMDLLEKYDATIEEQMKVDFLVDGLIPEYKRHVFGKHKTPDEVFTELRKLQTMGMTDESIPVFMIPTSNNFTPSAPTTSTWSNNQPQVWQPQNPHNLQKMNNVRTFNAGRGRNDSYQSTPQNYQNQRFTGYQSNQNRFQSSAPNHFAPQRQSGQQNYTRNIYPPLPRPVKTCYCCQAPDHFIANCPVRQSNPQQQQYQNNQYQNNEYQNQQNLLPSAPTKN